MACLDMLETVLWQQIGLSVTTTFHTALAQGGDRGVGCKYWNESSAPGSAVCTGEPVGMTQRLETSGDDTGRGCGVEGRIGRQNPTQSQRLPGTCRPLVPPKTTETTCVPVSTDKPCRERD